MHLLVVYALGLVLSRVLGFCFVIALGVVLIDTRGFVTVIFDVLGLVCDSCPCQDTCCCSCVVIL